MQFNEDLFWALAKVYPDMTVRSLSHLMGKSDGYWSSINSQMIPVPNSSLVQLLDALECQSIKTEPYSAKKKRIDEAKALITSELVARFHVTTGIDQAGVFQSARTDPVGHYGAMPFVVSSY
jgi:hypothetical protein